MILDSGIGTCNCGWQFRYTQEWWGRPFWSFMCGHKPLTYCGRCGQDLSLGGWSGESDKPPFPILPGYDGSMVKEVGDG